MSIDRLRNCPRCGDLFVYSVKDLCQKCAMKVEEAFERCTNFLRKKENRSSTIMEMSEKTGVSVSQITEFIQQKRLLIDDNPNLGYSCDGCGSLIREGRLCRSCSAQWQKTIQEEEGTNQESQPTRGSAGYYVREVKKPF